MESDNLDLAELKGIRKGWAKNMPQHKMTNMDESNLERFKLWVQYEPSTSNFLKAKDMLDAYKKVGLYVKYYLTDIGLSETGSIDLINITDVVSYIDDERLDEVFNSISNIMSILSSGRQAKNCVYFELTLERG